MKVGAGLFVLFERVENRENSKYWDSDGLSGIVGEGRMKVEGWNDFLQSHFRADTCVNWYR